MAMASTAFVSGLKTVGVKPRVLFSNSFVPTKLFVASITGRASRVETVDMPAPWPYMERGYSNVHAWFDGTKKRIGENSKVLIVEGPPAIGKSALARSIAEELEMKYFPMVTTDHYYINRYGFDNRAADVDLPPHIQSYDEKAFIKDPKRKDKLLGLQVILFGTRFRQYCDALAHVLNTGQGVVLDRCVYSDSVFVDTLYEMGYLKKHERAGIEKLKGRVMNDIMKPHLVVYLDAPVSVVEANLKNRGMGEEKVWNREMLEKLEYKYKQDYLKTISQHAELLAYDWSTPGEAEVIVEDIERIDFDRFDIHDPKMQDWRIKEDHDWNEKRWDFTTRVLKLLRKIQGTPVLDCPHLYIPGEDSETHERAMLKIPGNEYQDGFNPNLGDNVWFKQPKIWTNTWKDYDPKVAAKQ